MQEYRHAWQKYLNAKEGLSYVQTDICDALKRQFKITTKATPYTKTKMTTKERKQLRKSWNKLVNEQVKAGKTVYNYTSSLFDEGANYTRKSFETEIRALKEELNRYDQQRIDAALKLANAMAQNTQALAQLLDNIFTRH